MQPCEGARNRILIVEDEPALGRALARALGKHYDVTVASGGEQAFALMWACPFDAVLSDFAMQNGRGEQLYEQIRVALPGMEKRVVFMTGDASSPTARAWKLAVDNTVLEKPVPVKDLIDALRRITHALTRAPAA